jgi:hypothetical protein
MAKTTFEKDGWVIISQKYQKDWSVGPGPYRIYDVNREERTLKLDVAGVLLYVEMEETCIVDGTRLSYAEKERLAMLQEPWRKHRDQNLTEIFKPTPREAPDRPTVKPKPEAESKYIPGATYHFGAGAEYYIEFKDGSRVKLK